MLTDVRTFLKARQAFAGLISVARLTCTLLVAALVIAADTTPSVPTADAHRYLDDVKALTTPAMEGRGDGSKGLSRAAKLIEERYKSLGLQPAGKNGSFEPCSGITGTTL